MPAKRRTFAVEAALKRYIQRRIVRPAPLPKGVLELRLGGPQRGVWHIQTAPKSAKLHRGPCAKPTLRVVGNSERIGAIIQGEKDPRTAFLEGGIRVHGSVSFLQQFLGRHLGFARSSGKKVITAKRRR